MLIPFSVEFVERHPEVYELVHHSLFRQVVYYVLDSRYKRSTRLVPWLEEQVIDALSDQAMIDLVDTIPDRDDFDQQAVEILKWVHDNVEYVFDDSEDWRLKEYWQTVTETVVRMKGDCEDGAILQYVLCRLKGIPANRLKIFAGDVKGGGHCWLGYRPIQYPLNWVFLDWTTKIIGSDRPLYDVQGQSIVTHGVVSRLNHDYERMWFAFNEISSHRVLRLSSKNIAFS